MSYFAVIREAGPAWSEENGITGKSIESWNPFVGAERLSSGPPSPAAALDTARKSPSRP
jgi:hypothetical protein